MTRRNYIKPIIKTYSIDNDISLVMMTHTDEGNPPDDPFGSQAASEQPTQQNNFESNPFEEKK